MKTSTDIANGLGNAAVRTRTSHVPRDGIRRAWRLCLAAVGPVLAGYLFAACFMTTPEYMAAKMEERRRFEEQLVNMLRGGAKPQPASVALAADYDGRRVAVLPLRAEVDLVGLSVSDMFVTEVFKTGRFVLVERSQLSKVLGESELTLAGLTDAKAAEVGGIAGADAVLVGTVPEYGTVANKGKVLAAGGISCRLIDCKSGQVVWTESRSRKATSPDIIPSQLARDVVAEMCASLTAPPAAAQQAVPSESAPPPRPSGAGGGGMRIGF